MHSNALNRSNNIDCPYFEALRIQKIFLMAFVTLPFALIPCKDIYEIFGWAGGRIKYISIHAAYLSRRID